jgi:hypothetical protein
VLLVIRVDYGQTEIKQFSVLFSQFLLFFGRRHRPISTRLESVVKLSKTRLRGRFWILAICKGAMIVKERSRGKWAYDTRAVLRVLLLPILHFWCGIAFRRTTPIIFTYLIPLKELLSYFSCLLHYSLRRGTRWRSWLRHCATNRKVAGSIPDIIILLAALWFRSRLGL